ncbi:MAG: acetyl-CoA carboxylase biotin carboxylase subunit family protein [Pseudonocardiaceae bacterium]
MACIAGRRVVEVLADLGLRTVLLDEDIPFETALLADVPIEVDLDDWEGAEAVLRRHHEQVPLAAVLTVRDSHVPLAAYLAARLGVRGLALPAALNCGNKVRLRYVLDGAGLPNARYGVVDELSQVGPTGDELGYPLVLKRPAGAGGAGVRLCRDRTELEVAAQQLAARCRRPADPARGIPRWPGVRRADGDHRRDHRGGQHPGSAARAAATFRRARL